MGGFVQCVGQEDFDVTLQTKLFDKIMTALGPFCERESSLTTSGDSSFHPARQSWFIESEFCVLSFFCERRSGQDSLCHLLSPMAFSLIGRLNIGHEAMAAYIFQQEKLFRVRNEERKTDEASQSLQTLFLSELSLDDRKIQLNHSSNIFTSSWQPGMGSLTSLRCTADFAGTKSSAGVERFILPLGGFWMYNVLSSTMPSPPDKPLTLHGNNQHSKMLIDLVSHTLGLILQLETESSPHSFISNGAKLYHISNVCLLPEEILASPSVGSSLGLLFQQFSGFGCGTMPDLSLVQGFIKACYQHSRLSHDSKKIDNEKDPTELVLNVEQLHSTDYSKDELKALDDFVGDLCDSYMEYGGQYALFTNFIRLFLRHDFPPNVITSVLAKLDPILHVLTIEEEDRDLLLFSLTQSVSGGLPSLDLSHPDPSSILNSFSLALEKRSKDLSRNDYVYLLAVAVLGRNLACCSQRCSGGVQAMVNRLLRVTPYAFHDIVQVCNFFLHLGTGTKETLIACVLDICGGERRGCDTTLTIDETTAFVRSAIT